MASSPGCDQELHHPWFTSSPRASVTSFSHRSSLISCPLSLHVLQSTVFIKCCCDIHLPNLCPSTEKYYVGHTLNTSSSTFSPSRTSSLLQLHVQMSDEWQRVLFKFTENINSASQTKRCTVWTSLWQCYYSVRTETATCSFLCLNIFAATSPPQKRAHSITNTLQYNRAAPYSAPTSIPTHPCALLVWLHKNHCHHPTCDWILGAVASHSDLDSIVTILARTGQSSC